MTAHKFLCGQCQKQKNIIKFIFFNDQNKPSITDTCAECLGIDKSTKQLKKNIIVTDKTCAHCKKTQPICQFGKHKHTRDHLQSWCKSCYKDYKQKYNIKNREQINKYARDNGYSKYAYQKQFINKRKSREVSET